jgi:hypothetical protein
MFGRLLVTRLDTKRMIFPTPNNGNGNSQSFVDGCEAWAIENGDEQTLDNRDLLSDGSENE